MRRALMGQGYYYSLERKLSLGAERLQPSKPEWWESESLSEEVFELKGGREDQDEGVEEIWEGACHRKMRIRVAEGRETNKVGNARGNGNGEEGKRGRRGWNERMEKRWKRGTEGKSRRGKRLHFLSLSSFPLSYSLSLSLSLLTCTYRSGHFFSHSYLSPLSHSHKCFSSQRSSQFLKSRCIQVTGFPSCSS